MNILNFIIDLFFNIHDIWDTLKEKDEKILSKIIGVVITIVCIFVSAKIWLKF